MYQFIAESYNKTIKLLGFSFYQNDDLATLEVQPEY